MFFIAYLLMLISLTCMGLGLDDEYMFNIYDVIGVCCWYLSFMVAIAGAAAYIYQVIA